VQHPNTNLIKAFQHHYATLSRHANGDLIGNDAVDSLRLKLDRAHEKNLAFFVENQVDERRREVLQSLKADEYLDITSIVAFPDHYHGADVERQREFNEALKA
jgi:hypothetical protein